jgi:hypothetical protein
MGAEKIAEFYDDELKMDCDLKTSRAAEYCRQFSTNDGPLWRARRWRAYLRPRARALLAPTRSVYSTSIMPSRAEGRGAKPAA